MKIEIEVPDDSQLVTDMAEWTDGDEYSLKVRQTAPMKFEGISGEPVEAEAEDEETEDGPPMPKRHSKSDMPPALMIVMGKRK